jgi:DNA polymerase III alpha subunit (gram-positive type)
MSKLREVFISVDVETSGPIVAEYSMLALGACLVASPKVSFSVMLKPISKKVVAEALAVTGLSLEQADEDGLSPEVGMAQFKEWIAEQVPKDATPVFVGLNAPFDWSFVNYYFHRFCGNNPFGFTALDIKALFMGATGCAWHDTKSSAIAELVHPTLVGDHNALHDAQYQAELFRLVMNLTKKKNSEA